MYVVMWIYVRRGILSKPPEEIVLDVVLESVHDNIDPLLTEPLGVQQLCVDRLDELKGVAVGKAITILVKNENLLVYPYPHICNRLLRTG